MIQIDMQMPESCLDCPFYDEICPLVPFADVAKNKQNRSQCCPLHEVPEKEHFKFETPEQCVNCQSMMPFGDNYYCHMEAISPDNSQQDISTIFVDPELRPGWCPMIRLNDKIKDLTPKQRETIDKLATGLSELFGK